MSALAWITFIICSVAVIIRYMTVGDSRFLLFAIPGLILLLLIPMALAWMSRRSYMQAAGEYSKKARFSKIAKITLGMTGNIVRVTGDVQKISFKWLNRPHFHVKDETGGIRVIMFTAPAEKIKTGDKVDVLGIVMKNIFARKTPVISAVSVKKVND